MPLKAGRTQWRRALGVGVVATALLAALSTVAGGGRAAAGPVVGQPYGVFIAGTGGVSRGALSNVGGAALLSGVPSGGPIAINVNATTAILGEPNNSFGRVATIGVHSGVTTSISLLSGGANRDAVATAIAAAPNDASIAYVAVSNTVQTVFALLTVSLSPLAITQTCTLDFSPTSVAVTPDGGRIFVGGYVLGPNRNPAGERIAEMTAGGCTGPSWAGISNRSAAEVNDLAVSPDGTKLFVSDSAGLVGLTVNGEALFAPPVGVLGAGPLTVSPDGGSVYVALNPPATFAPSSASVARFSTLSLGLAGHTGPLIGVGSTNAGTTGITGLATAPDGGTLLAAGWDGNGAAVFPIATSSMNAGPRVGLGGLSQTTAPESIAITPDQAPVASFGAAPSVAGTPTSFDASSSSVAYGQVTKYSWNFGDGGTATTGGPTVTHTYATAGNYTVTLTETDSAGTSIPPAVASFGVDGPGQTPYLRSDPSARTTRPVVIPAPPPHTTTTVKAPGTTAPTVPGATTTTQPGATPTTTTPGGTTTTTIPGSSPKIMLNPAVGPPGTLTTVTGTGFPPNAAVTLTWTPGTGTVQVVADGSGNFTTQMMIIVPDILGPRQAQAVGYPTATAPFLVVPDSAQPGGSNAALLFRSEGP